MADFEAMGKAMAESQTLNTDQEIQGLKNRKNLINTELDQMLAVLNQQKVKQDAIKSQMKFEQKERQIQADLLKSAIDQQAQTPLAVGGSMVDEFAPAIEPGAESLPLLDQMG